MSNASTLVYHMRRIAERAGVRWDSDCEEEVHDVVKDIERQIEKVREEVRELRALVGMYKAPADLVRNVAALDDRVLMSADVNLLRATLREFRDQARAIADG